MTFSKLVFLSLILSVSAYALTREPGLDLSLEFEGRWVEETFHRAQTGGLDVGAQFDHNLSDSLTVSIDAIGRLQTGAYVSSFVDEYGAQQGLVLREASMRWTPFVPLQLRWGVLPHNTLPTLIHDKAFTGVGERLSLDAGAWRFSIDAEQSFASSPSRTLFPTFANSQFPAFLKEAASVNYWWQDGSAGLYVQHFAFLNLSREVEYRSRFFGNSGTGSTRENASLSYNFHGIALGGNWEARWGSLRSNLQFDAHRNFDPPPGKRDALLGTVGLAWQWSPAVVSGLTVSLFHIESDAGPGFYSNKFLGHNNRRGLGASVYLDFPTTPLRVELGYTNAEPIDANAFQNRFQQAFLLFETSYDLL
ncbi:MAG: hypothetical protein H6617_07385 [Bdellovibrionaceae bacterium]|nr:hypothetical protein [Bdellovibrionales bacterium]MCB9254490.1 hypothetical protein [Pseudobdellovibrionaceae bacterium]